MLLLWLDLESHKWSLALDTSPPLSTLWNTELVVSPIWKISPVPLKVWTVAPRISLHCWAQEFHQHLDVESIEIRQWQVPWHSPLARHADWRVHTSASACDLGAVAWCHPAIFRSIGTFCHGDHGMTNRFTSAKDIQSFTNPLLHFRSKPTFGHHHNKWSNAMGGITEGF